MNWKTATCETCCFRVGDECRRFPQFKEAKLYSFYGGHTMHPSVIRKDIGYAPACAEHSEIIPSPAPSIDLESQ